MGPRGLKRKWEPILTVMNRTFYDFEFSYCDYRIGDTVYTDLSPKFIEAFKKEKMWASLSD